jgi:hypothetical protein
MNIRCNKIVADPPPVYRIFLDQQLVVERRFWPETPDYYIQEQLTLSNYGNKHEIRIKNVFLDLGEIFVHDVNFFNGEDRQTVQVEYEFDNENQFTFVLPKR